MLFISERRENEKWRRKRENKQHRMQLKINGGIIEEEIISNESENLQ